MSLRHKAAATAMFAYLNFAVAIVTGLFLVPLTLHSIGARVWGVWLASGEVLAYAALTDLGMLGVLQWMIAEAEGRKDREEMAQLVAQAVWLGVAMAIVYVVVAMLLWRILPSALFLTAADRDIVAGPLALSVLLVAIAYPLGGYRALVAGTQDIAFLGTATLAQGALGAALTAVLLIKGYGLYALVLASAAPQLLGGMVFAIRAASLAPDVVFRVPVARVPMLRLLFSNGIGVWLSNLGGQALAASNGIVITYLGHPEWVVVYACTSKLAGMCQSLAWVLPDSGHVGLAQLHGAGRSRARIAEVITLMQRLHLVIAGAVACGLLAFNPSFVVRWVGPQMFAGLTLNALLAVGVVVHSFTHGLLTSASIAGNRPRVGVLVVINGAVQGVLAIFLGHRFGLIGVAVASLLGVMLTSLPGSVALLRTTTNVAARPLVRQLVAPWTARATPWLVVAAAVGLFYQAMGVWLSAAAATAVCLAYTWGLRPFFADGLPLDQRWIDWLRRFRLFPSATAPAPAMAGAAFVEKLETGR